jgi:hypothetical protein
MLVYTPDSFLIKPGIISMILGLVISTPLIFGPISFVGMGFDLYTMLLGLSLSVFGYAIFQVGIISRLIHGYRSGIEIFIQKKLTYNNGLIISIILIFIGIIFELLFLKNYLSNGLRVDFISYTAIEGLLLILVGVQTFGFTLIIELINISMTKKELNAK